MEQLTRLRDSIRKLLEFSKKFKDVFILSVDMIILQLPLLSARKWLNQHQFNQFNLRAIRKLKLDVQAKKTELNKNSS